MTQDKFFLRWLALRLVEQYGEHPNTDFVCKLLSIAQSLPDTQDTPNTESFRTVPPPWTLQRGPPLEDT